MDINPGIVRECKNKVLGGESITKAEALRLADAEIETLCSAADELRKHFCKNKFDMCTIINGKSGRCTENCKFCAQSGCYSTGIERYPLLSADKILDGAEYNADRGVLRYSIVTSGKNLNDTEIEKVCGSIKEIKSKVKIEICASFGLLNREQYIKLKEAGVSRIHNNLETSRRYFPKVCTTHTYDDKIDAINAAMEAGLEVCSGGIMGIGESMEDRIDMFLDIRKLGIKSVPVNMLNPVKGTPYGEYSRPGMEEMRRIVAVARFILPDAMIRMAGGRRLMADMGESCFRSGANACISGDMLTTTGISIENDMKITGRLGYEVYL